MAQATAHPHTAPSEDVHSTYVYGAGDESIGKISLIDKLSGRVVSAVMSFGGFLGLAHSHYPIPWAALKYDTSLRGYGTGITEAQLCDATEFSHDSWQDRDSILVRCNALMDRASTEGLSIYCAEASALRAF